MQEKIIFTDFYCRFQENKRIEIILANALRISGQSNVWGLKRSSTFITKLKWRYNVVSIFCVVSLSTSQNMQEKSTLTLVDF